MSSPTDESEPDVQELKSSFVEARDYWHPAFDHLLRLDPEFFAKYFDLSTHAWREGTLDPKVKHLIYVAVHTSPATHLSPEETRKHIGNALDNGATVREILTVLELLSTAGIHSVLKGVPIIAEEGGTPEPESDAEAEAQAAARETFEARRGYWDDGLWAELLAIDHEFLEHYTEYSAHVAHYSSDDDPADPDDLDPLVKEYIYIALDASLPAFYLGGLRAHIKNALEYGASHREVLEVLELTSELGIHSVTNGLPILAEEAAARGLLPDRE
jgi:alkylhydroperoxidase/carboxymuconolactone decarboxylase family protein YurZ